MSVTLKSMTLSHGFISMDQHFFPVKPSPPQNQILPHVPLASDIMQILLISSHQLDAEYLQRTRRSNAPMQ